MPLSKRQQVAAYSFARAARSLAPSILPKNSSRTMEASTAAQPGAAGVSLELEAESMSALANSSLPREET